MAQQEVTDSGVLVVPGAYAKTVVQTTPAGIAVNGVLAVVGESEEGPAFDEETDLSQNLFGPDALSDIEAKYGQGQILDAARLAAAASNDPNIVGSFNRILPVKTNTGTKAAGSIPAIGGGTWSAIEAVRAGARGNLITRTVTERTAEVLPTTGSTVLAPPQQNTDVEFRVNGGSAVTGTLTAAALPSAMVTTINGLAGVAATGGTNRAVLTGGEVGDNLTLTVDSGFQVHIEIDTAYAATPTVGDILYLPTGGPFAAANEGTYVVTAASSTRIDAYKLLDAAGSGAALTPPSTEGPVAIAAATDLAAFAPVVITLEAGAVVPGKGKSLEVAESGSENFNDIAFTFAGAAASPPADNATWVSTAAAPTTIASETEYTVELVVARAADGVSETLASTIGGDVVLTLGYDGTTGSAVIADGELTITVTGGSGTSPDPIDLETYETVADLVEFLNTLTGFTAAAANAALGQKLSINLDPGTYGIASAHGAMNGRIKQDGFALKTEINQNSTLIRVTEDAPAGLPDEAALAFLSGGARGATTNTRFQAAFDALKGPRVNFVAPLVSRDATSDIDDGLTDAASTYTIAAVNAQLRSHVLQMSQLKQRRRRQGFASIRGTYTAAKAQAGNLASGRVALFFQDVRAVDGTGELVQLQPWGAAVLAAAMQAAGFYRAIVAKFINISGALQAAGDWNDQFLSQLEDALLNGLCPITRDETGGYKWVSDQTSYTKDANFVHNSIQATYVADVIAATAELQMERAFVGQSVADVNKALALTKLDALMTELRRLKLIAPDDTAPNGYRDVKVRIEGPSLRFSVTVRLAGAIYFVTIDFLVTPVQQAAG